MKMNYIKNWPKYFLSVLGISGMMLFSACDTSNRNEDSTRANTETAVTSSEQPGNNEAIAADTTTFERTTNAVDSANYNNTFDDTDATTSESPEASDTGTTTNNTEATNSENPAQRTNVTDNAVSNDEAATAEPEANTNNAMVSGTDDNSTIRNAETEEAGNVNTPEEAETLNSDGTTGTIDNTEALDNQYDATEATEIQTTTDTEIPENADSANIVQETTALDSANNSTQSTTTSESNYTEDQNLNPVEDSTVDANTTETNTTTATNASTTLNEDEAVENLESVEAEGNLEADSAAYNNTDAETTAGGLNIENDADSMNNMEISQQLRQEYAALNEEIREMLRQNPDVNMRYTSTGNSDFDYGNYGVTYEGIADEATRKKFTDLETRRADIQQRLRGKIDASTNAYTAADVNAVPAKGYDELFNFIEDQINYPVNAQAANIEGTIFVEFMVDPQGNISEPKIVDTIEGERETIIDPLNPTQFTEQEREEAIREMEEEAKRAVKATNGMWESAQMGNESVTQTVQLPVRFRIEDNNENR